MGTIFTSAQQLIGRTPLLELQNLQKDTGCRILAKLECFNPAGSAKDRVALAMIRDAQDKGLLVPGATIIEPTSGNTGLGLAAVAAVQGYRCIIVMPDSMSIERQLLMKAYGAQVVLTPGKLGMRGAIQKANVLAASIPDSFIPGQFDNPANPLAHYRTTGPEIWADTRGDVDIFVAGVGTGGTVTGVGKYLKEQSSHVQVVAVEPAGSPLLSTGKAGSHGIQGIGANFVPSVLDTGIYDQIITVTDADACAAARAMGSREGILVGISSGAALHAALELAREPANKNKTIVALLPDSGERYLSTKLYQP